MQMKQLEALVNVIDFRSFSKAAEATYLSQPTISSHIRILEREVGTKLVVRSTKEIYPSHEGKILYGYAKEILKLRERALLELKKKKSDLTGTLQIAISDYPSQYFLPEFLSSFSNIYPDLSFNIRNFPASDVARVVLENQAEIGITESPIEQRNLIYEDISVTQSFIITPDTKEYRELKKNDVDFRKLFKTSRVILCEDGAHLYQMMMRYITTLGLERRELNIIATMQNVNGVVESVQQGLGVSLVPENYLQDKESLLIFPDNNQDLKQKFSLTRHASRTLSPAAEVFAKELKRAYISKKSGPAANI
ncbi:MAG TPA: LysR family transcriptional regulator [Candidatus Eisenbacteria bacterium]|nr:LysR family transcriptional regulator [Candidatus Eisenbacteria bacterium]